MNALNGYDFEDLRPGMQASFAKTITEADIILFAGASGDNNAMHINEEFAQGTAFKGRIAHGMLTASVISAAIAGRLPGPGTVYLSQSLRFKAPVRPKIVSPPVPPSTRRLYVSPAVRPVGVTRLIAPPSRAPPKRRAFPPFQTSV